MLFQSSYLTSKYSNSGKEARKKELKKNKKQRQMVRAAVLKGKDPVQLIAEMEKIDQMGKFLAEMEKIDQMGKFLKSVD